MGMTESSFEEFLRQWGEQEPEEKLEEVVLGVVSEEEANQYMVLVAAIEEVEVATNKECRAIVEKAQKQVKKECDAICEKANEQIQPFTKQGDAWWKEIASRFGDSPIHMRIKPETREIIQIIHPPSAEDSLGEDGIDSDDWKPVD